MCSTMTPSSGTFSVYDKNQPKQFFINCVGAILKPGMKEGYPDIIQILTTTSNGFEIGVPLPHDLAELLYEKIVKVSKDRGQIIIPDFSNMDDEQMKIAIDEIMY